MPSEHPENPTDQRVTTASDKKHTRHNTQEEGLIPSTMLGSYMGGMGTNLSTRALLRANKFPFQGHLNPKGYTREILPIVVTSAGTMSGYITAKKLKQLSDASSTKRKK